MKSNFKTCLSVTLEYEGGYSDHPSDPGGATMQGITQKVYDEYRAREGKDAKPVHEMYRAEMQTIYDLQYWDRAHCDELPKGIDLVVFDYAVNSGVGRAVKDLQRVVGCVVDGVAGVGTVAAAVRADPATVINAVCDRRMTFLRSLKTWGTFGKGWSARVANVRSRALAMIGGTDEVAPPVMLPSSAKAPEKAQAKLKTQEGSGLTIGGTGAAGQTLMQAADQVQPHFSDTMLGRLAIAAFAVLMIAGGALVLLSYVKRMKERGGFFA